MKKYNSLKYKVWGNGLYKIIPENIICGDKFLEKVNEAILDYIKEYNIDTSAQHPTFEGDDIVRAYAKDKHKNQEVKNS